jgi:hypothetical protein
MKPTDDTGLTDPYVSSAPYSTQARLGVGEVAHTWAIVDISGSSTTDGGASEHADNKKINMRSQSAPLHDHGVSNRHERSL